MSAPPIDASQFLRDAARSAVRRNAFLAIGQHHRSMSAGAFRAIVAALVFLRIYCLLGFLFAELGWFHDPAYWAGPDHPLHATEFTPLHHHPNPFGWRWGFQFFVGAHDVTGMLLFATCLIPLFVEKGGRAHVLVGRIFLGVWLLHLVDGLVNSGQIMLVRGFVPERYADVTNQGFSLYLYMQFAFISSMVIDFLAHGLAALHYKNRAPSRAMRGVMLFLPATSFLLGVALTIWAIGRLVRGGPPETPNTYPFAWVFVVQVPAYLYLIGRNLQYWLRPEPRNWLHGWVTEHQRNLMFCVQVTLYTGLANIASHYAPALVPLLFGGVDVVFFAWLVLKERSIRHAVMSSRLGVAFVAAMRSPVQRERRSLVPTDRAWFLDSFDLNRNGRLDLAEVEAVLREQGIAPTAEELGRIRERLDLDGSGTIDTEELRGFLARWVGNDPHDEDELRVAFRLLDTDGDGRLSIAELERALAGGAEALTPAELEAVFASLDTDGSGRIEWREFCAALGPSSAVLTD
jgi:Ca2+-binding EF-hand superfamily protein